MTALDRWTTPSPSSSPVPLQIFLFSVQKTLRGHLTSSSPIMLPPLLLLPFLALSATATPLTVSLTSCATKSSTNTSSALLNFSSGYAQIVRNEEGLVGPSGGTGDWLMRMNLVGESSKVSSECEKGFFLLWDDLVWYGHN
jgi:hypothetical protein